VLRGSIAAVLLLASAPALAREKTDVLLMVNGDRITGEIKGMTRGKLDLSTDDVGRIDVEWVKIAQVSSKFPYDVELSDGERFTGVLSSPKDGEIAVGLLPIQTVVPIDQVVELVQMNEAFLGRIRVIFDLGFTLAKANSAMTLSTSGEVGYRAQSWGTKLTFDGYYQDDDNNVAVSRATVALQGDLYFEKHWRAFLAFQVDHNDELDLKIRTSIASGAAYAAVRNNWTELWVSAGLTGSREQYNTGDANYTLDAMVGATWEAFRYDSPKLDVVLDAMLLPGLSDWGRLRGTGSFKIKYEVFKDFNVGLQFSDTFDTRPPDTGAPKNDYIASVTIGWSYRR
jgi:hypothetical protein